MTAPPAREVSVVVPVYDNAATLPALHARLVAALGDRLLEAIYVDDASRDDSAAVLRALASRDPRAVVVERPTNGGQHRALLDGLARASGAWVVCLDADLQDPPEALPALLVRAAGPDEPPVVFGGRRGGHASLDRRLTSRAFKGAQAALTGLPGDASSLVALRADVAGRVLELDDGRRPPFVPGMVATAARGAWASVPVERAASAAPSGYSTRTRVAAGTRGLRWALAARRSARHDATQRAYYERRESRSIQPRPTPYTARQVREAIAFGGLRAGDRVLDVGCGMGRATLLLARHGLAVEGLDLSPALLARLAATPGGEGLALHAGDLAHPPAELHGRFDAVAGFFVLHHLADLEAALRGAVRTLRPGGRAVFVEPNAFCPLFYAQIAGTPGMTFRADGGIVRMRAGRLRRAAAAAGLVDVATATFGMLPPALVNRPRGRALEALAERPEALAPVRAFRVLSGRAAQAGL
jgi:SAM-dependent methyltransferase